MLKRNHLIGAAILGLILAVVLYAKFRFTAFTTDVLAISDDEAVLVMRQNTNRTTRYWVTLQGTDGPRWVHRVPADTRAVIWDSLTVTDDRVLYQRQGSDLSPEVIALARDSGEVAWSTVLGSTGEYHQGGFLYADAQAHGDQVIMPTVTDEAALVALALEDGTVRWRAPVPSFTRIFDRSDEALWLLSDDSTFTHLRLADGVLTDSGLSSYNHCLYQGQLFTLRDGSLLSVAGETIVEEVGVEGSLRACGTYDGALILTVIEEDEHHIVKVRDGVVEDSLRLGWDLRLSMSLSGGLVYDDVTEHHPLHGEMTRYLPLIYSRGQEDERFDLIVVDLARMLVLRQATPQRDYLHLAQLRSGSMHYLWYHGGLLIALDGQTGALAGAARGGRDFSGRQVADEVVWLAEEGSEGWQPPRRPAAVWLDARTLAIQGHLGKTDRFGSAMEDVTELTGWAP